MQEPVCAKCFGQELLDFLTESAESNPQFLANLFATTGFQVIALSLMSGKLRVAKLALETHGPHIYSRDQIAEVIKGINAFYQRGENGKASSVDRMVDGPRPGCCGRSSWHRLSPRVGRKVDADN